MLRRGSGAIVNTSSIWALVGARGASVVDSGFVPNSAPSGRAASSKEFDADPSFEQCTKRSTADARSNAQAQDRPNTRLNCVEPFIGLTD